MQSAAGLEVRGVFRSETSMPPGLRKFVGSLAVLAFLALYVWAAAGVAERLPDQAVVQLVYFVLAGTLWGVPLLPLITWIQSGRWGRK